MTPGAPALQVACTVGSREAADGLPAYLAWIADPVR
jgi:hypothetical protein